MRLKPRTWFLISVALFVAGAWMWHYAESVSLSRHNAETPKPSSALKPPLIKTSATVAAKRKTYRVSNTHKTFAQLLHNDHAIILRNALIDTARPLSLDIPSQLRSKGVPGSYIVQFDRPLNQEFYDSVKKDGGQFVTYIPNNAALVKANPAQAEELQADPVFQAVIPFEPYYKLDGALLPGAVDGLPQTNLLSVTTFPGERDTALAALTDLGAKLVGEDQGPFGPTLVVSAPPDSVAAIAQLPLAQEVEKYASRRLLNDLSRVQLGVSVDTLTNTPNYLNLSGSNVTVSLNDTGVDATHPDFSGSGATVRLTGGLGALQDFDGHGTHVAGIIAGNGQKSSTVTQQIPGSVIPGADFRGKATNATLFVQNLDLVIGPFVSDGQLQVNASTNLGPTNLISNNSWGYGSSSYDSHAASFDAATRDAQPGVKGEQPLLFVFASGDGGNGDDSGVDGQNGTVNSPGTAKNVITVGASDSPRYITNLVSYDGQTTNQVFFNETDNSNLIAYFSGSGNVGVGVEGTYGRFKPDVVAPGVFIVSCRSSTYVDPTNEVLVTDYGVTNQSVEPGKTNYYPVQFPADGSELIVQVVTNSGSPVGFTNGFIVRVDSNSPPSRIRGTKILGANVVVLTNQVTPGPLFVGVASGAGTIQPVAYDVHIYVFETNSFGDYFTVLKGMNSALKPWYRYESGTSMSAGAVSGVLALMQDFLEHEMKVIPSPALLKAMLINGSRSIGLEYDFDVKSIGANEQGWGMPNIANCIPSSVTNSTGNGRSIAFFDQSPAEALSTGQYQTYTITAPGGAATNSPVRITLVWTDPPGDPAAGVALVNQLSLTVTDSTGTNVFVGNDFFSGDTFSEINTGDAPDTLNNVQNVYINNSYYPIVYPLTVTVGAARVNVNAATTQTSRIAQDYALVISSDDPTAPVAVTSSSILAVPTASLVTDASSGVPLLHERVGANQPTLWNFATGGTNGSLSQWHFFVFTNMALSTNKAVTNVAFATFLPPNLSVPRNTQADIDMYVSTDPKLLLLDKLAVFRAFKSVGRGGTETFVTNSAAPVWYIGIKAEDQQSADFGFYAVAQENPFSVQNPNGSVTATGTALPVFIGDAAAGAPALVFAFLIDPINPGMRIQDVTVKLGIQHGNPSDLAGTLMHNGVSSVLHHHSGAPGGFTNTYDDLQEQPTSGSTLTDGPGSLKNFVGQSGQGLWMLTEADSALGQVGEVETFMITATPQPMGLGFQITLPPSSWFKDYIAVPNDATNLTIFTTYASQGGGPVGIFLTNFDDVEFGDYTTNHINPPGGSLTLTTNAPKPYPPLSGGTWYYGIYNYNTVTPVTLNVLIQIQESLVPNLVETFSNNVITPLLTGGTTQSQICISSGQQVVDLSVGLRINDTNLTDLAIHLTSPQGTSVLLFENRGGMAAQNLGLGTRANSNLVYTVFTEDTNLTQTPIKFAPAFASKTAITTSAVIASNGFESSAVKTYTNGQIVEGGWKVATNQVGVVGDATLARSGKNYLALANGRLTNTFATVPGGKYQLTYWMRGADLTDWWPGDLSGIDIITANSAALSGVTYRPGLVGEAFYFPNTVASYVQGQIAQLGLAGFTLEEWVNFQSNARGVLGCMPGTPTANEFGLWFVGTPGNGTGGTFFAQAGSQAVISYPSTSANGTWHHVAYSYDEVNTTQTLYVDGQAVASSSVSGPLSVGASLFLGTEPGGPLTGSFNGLIDEPSLYDRALSPAEIEAIYQSDSAGKYNANSLLPNFQVSIDGYSTNTIVRPSFDGTWTPYTNSFVATNTQTTIELVGNTLGSLFDDVEFVELPSTNYNNYFLPEEPMTPFIGQNPQGCWTLDVWDTRTDSPLPDDGTLYSWDMNMTISSTNVDLIVLTNGIAYKNATVPGNSITYFGVDVPPAATFATNVLFNGSRPLNLLFDQSALPTGALPGDVTLVPNLRAGTQGSNVLASVGAPPPLIRGARYFLGVQNTGPKAATFSLEVIFNVPPSASITHLTNNVPSTTNILSGSIEYYSISLPGNSVYSTFQVLNASGPLNLYVRAAGAPGLLDYIGGTPAPSGYTYDYLGQDLGLANYNVIAVAVTTNSLPVALPSTPGAGPTTWYIGVENPTGTSVNYRMLATFVTNGPSGPPGTMDIMALKPGFAKAGTAPVGYPTNVAYSFTVANNPTAVQFVLTGGGGSLTMLANRGSLPTTSQAYSDTFRSPQTITIATNSALPSVNGTWYVMVPNTGVASLPYSITATTIISSTPVVTQPFVVVGDPLPSQPSFIGSRIVSPASGFSLYWNTTAGHNYNIEVSTDLTTWTVVTNIVAQSNTAAYIDSIPVNMEPARFFRITAQ